MRHRFGRMTPSKKSKDDSPVKQPGFEEILDRLQRLVQQLETGDLPLETAVALFEEGVHLSQLGSQRLDEAELKVEELLADPKQVKTRALNPDLAGKS